MLTLFAADEEQQETIGAALARAIPPSCIIYLEGELGSGKTTLVRGFMRGMGHQGAVKSPTYTLVEPYEFASRHCFHFDLYRVSDPEELEYLGLRDMLERDSVLLVEWPERGEGGLPAADLLIRISYRKEGRELHFQPVSEVGIQLIQRINEELQDKVNADSYE